MKLIFLDVDGVLNSSRTALITPMKGKTWMQIMIDGIDPVAMKLVNRLAEENDAHFVISSSHRYDYLFPETTTLPNGVARDMVDLTRLRIYFGQLGLNQDRIVGATPDMICSNRMRGDEVQRWLNLYSEDDEFVILDDVDEFRCLRDNFVHVNGDDGFSYRNYQDAEIVLRGYTDNKPRIILPPK